MKATRNKKKISLLLHTIHYARSAPASPSHMAGSFTPDCLSREGSPIPEAGVETEVSQASTATSQVSFMQQVQQVQQQQQQQQTQAGIADLRFSQSAPGSPSGEIVVFLVRRLFPCFDVLLFFIFFFLSTL